jgi:hypothetical protein
MRRHKIGNFLLNNFYEFYYEMLRKSTTSIIKRLFPTLRTTKDTIQQCPAIFLSLYYFIANRTLLKIQSTKSF